MPKIRCIFHDDGTASLHIYEDGFFCFGCGKSGPLHKLPKDLVDIDEEDLRPKYIEPVDKSIAWIKSLPTTDIRGLTLHHDSRAYYLIWPGNHYYLKRFKEVLPGQPKYIGPAGHERPLFLAARVDSDTLIIVEGEINAVSMSLANPGVNIVSPGSASEFYSKSSIKNLPYYNKFSRILIVVDKDAAGAKAAIELKSLLLSPDKEVNIFLWERDANEILVNYGKEELNKEIQKCLDMQRGLPTNG